MSAFHSSTLANGHTLTVVETDDQTLPVPRRYYRIEERNSLGIFLAVAFVTASLHEASSWVERAVKRGYGLRVAS